MQLQSDITDAARKKFKNANPKKEYPDDGYSVMQRLGITDKVEQTKKLFKDIWDRTMPAQTVDYITLRSEAVEADDDGEGNEYTRNLYSRINQKIGKTTWSNIYSMTNT